MVMNVLRTTITEKNRPVGKEIGKKLPDGKDERI
jgi:hypothetical protein